jgi:tetratricopeptide (TPR) repeat protein
VPYFERALEIRKKVFGAGHPIALATQSQLGSQYAHLKRHKEADALLREVVAIDEKLRGPENRETLLAKDALARAYIVAGRLRDAIAIYETVLPLALKSDGVDSGLYQQVANNLGLSYFRMTDFTGALPLMLQVEAYTKKAYAATDDAQERAQTNLGRTLMRLGRHDEAREKLSAAYEHARRNRGADSATALDIVTTQATNEMLAGNDTAARARLAQIEAWPPKADKTERADRQELARVRGRLAENQGKWDEALAHYKECEDLVAKSSGPLSSSAWLAKRYRAALLRKRNGPGDREAGAKLAQDIMNGVGSRIADNSPLWAELRAIREP